MTRCVRVSWIICLKRGHERGRNGNQPHVCEVQRQSGGCNGHFRGQGHDGGADDDAVSPGTERQQVDGGRPSGCGPARRDSAAGRGQPAWGRRRAGSRQSARRAGRWQRRPRAARCLRRRICRPPAKRNEARRHSGWWSGGRIRRGKTGIGRPRRSPDRREARLGKAVRRRTHLQGLQPVSVPDREFDAQAAGHRDACWPRRRPARSR